MLARIHIIISSESDNDYKIIVKELLEINPEFSISPSRLYPGLKDHSDFYVTCQIKQEHVQNLLDRLNNDWDGESDSCVCYGFNTKMFHPLVYCLEFELFI